MRKLRKSLSKFLATVLSVALMAQPAMTAFADELVPKAVTEMMESTVEIPGDAAAMSLLPLDREYAYLYLNDYTEEELKSVPLETVLEKLVDHQGNPVEVPEDATVVWTYFLDENGDEIVDEYDILDPDETVDLTPEYQYDSQISVEMIIGSGKQLDTNNVRYNVTVYLNEISENINFYVYEEVETDYWDRVDDEALICRPAYIDGLEIPMTEVLYVNSGHTEGKKYELHMTSRIAERAAYPNVQVDLYPMKEFVEYYQDGLELDGEITEDLLTDSWTIGNGYTSTFEKPDTEDCLNADNLFCLVYSDRETGDVFGYHGISFILGSEANRLSGKLYAYENSEMVLVSNEIEEDLDKRFWLYLDLESAESNKVSVSYETNWLDFELNEEYLIDAEYYIVLDNDDTIEKIVKGVYWSAENAKYAEDITEEIMPTDTTELPYGYLANLHEERERITLVYKDGSTEYYYLDVYGGKAVEDGTEYDPAPIVNDVDPYFQVNGAVGYDTFEVENDSDQTLDTLYGFGYQTVFIHDAFDDEQVIDLSNVIPYFWTPDDVKAHVGTEQKSGESVQDFSKGSVYYAVHIGDKLKNYNVTFAEKTTGPKLFVNGPEKREIFLDEYFENRHDILVANLGDEELTGLEVELIDAKNVAIDEYWNLGGEGNDTLAPFTETYLNGMANLAKIRLRPQEATDSNATVKGKVEGKLKISADDQEPVYIELTGYAGNPEIITATMSNAVEYVPYSFVVGTDNMHDWNKVTFSIEDGELPEGLKLYPATGEIYGVPLETGEFPITVMAEYSRDEFTPSYADFVLTVEDNTNENVYKASDEGYEIKEHVGTEVGDGTYDFFLEDFIEQTFTSNGEYDEFIDFWFNGEKLDAGEDYEKESGSTKITIRSQTFRKHAVNGANTIAAEFRVDGDKTKELKRTAQNFRMNIASHDDDDDDDEKEYTSSSSKKKPVVPAPVVDSNTVFTDQSWIRDDFGWWVKKADGSWLASTWYLLPYMGTMEWYYFGADGYMKTGWFEDVDGNKYYLHPISDGTMGRMYYGWQQIDGKWYYFNETSDGTKGALKKNTWVGDYYVDSNGVWVE